MNEGRRKPALGFWAGVLDQQSYEGRHGLAAVLLSSPPFGSVHPPDPPLQDDPVVRAPGGCTRMGVGARRHSVERRRMDCGRVGLDALSVNSVRAMRIGTVIHSASR